MNVSSANAFNILTNPATDFNQPSFTYDNIPKHQLDGSIDTRVLQQQQTFAPGHTAGTVSANNSSLQATRKLNSKYSSILKNSSAKVNDTDRNSEMSTPKVKATEALAQVKHFSGQVPSRQHSQCKLEPHTMSFHTDKRLFYRDHDDFLSSDSDDMQTPEMARKRDRQFIERVHLALRSQNTKKRSYGH